MDEAAGNSNLALDKLRTLLRSEGLDADGKLPTERALSQTFGVSRRAVRRALEVLEAEGLIWRRQGSGTFAGRRPDDWSEHVGSIVAGTDLMEVMEVRLRVEPQLAQLAAMRAKAADIERMYELVNKIYESTDADGRELWDGALHRQIAQCAGNQLFLAIFDVINRVRQDQAWQTIRERARSASKTRTVTYAQHTAIIEAIAARDPAKAGEAMRQHLLTLQESLIRITSLDHHEPKAKQELV
jgi:DNA-binding FadR family transcriptional regulator